MISQTALFTGNLDVRPNAWFQESSHTHPEDKVTASSSAWSCKVLVVLLDTVALAGNKHSQTCNLQVEDLRATHAHPSNFPSAGCSRDEQCAPICNSQPAQVHLFPGLMLDASFHDKLCPEIFWHYGLQLALRSRSL